MIFAEEKLPSGVTPETEKVTAAEKNCFGVNMSDRKNSDRTKRTKDTFDGMAFRKTLLLSFADCGSPSSWWTRRRRRTASTSTGPHRSAGSRRTTPRTGILDRTVPIRTLEINYHQEKSKWRQKGRNDLRHRTRRNFGEFFKTFSLTMNSLNLTNFC